MDKLFLTIVGFFNPILERSGVDTNQLREILRIKLLMDRRRPNMMFARQRQNGSKASPIMMNFFTILLGFLIGMLLFINDMPLIGQTSYFTIFMVLMSLTLIADFSTVLLDVRDQFIILPRPVDDRTIATSRILHITLYVMRIALTQGIPGIIMAGFADHSVWASLLLLVQIVEATLLSILLVNLIYLLMMRSVSPQRFKDIVGYFQIGFSILMFSIYYLLPRMIDISVLKQIDILAYKWTYLLPPLWIAALNETLVHAGRSGITVSLLAITGIVMPTFGLWLIIKVLAPGFNKRLVVLATSDGNSTAPEQVKKVYKPDLRDNIANLVCADPVENAGFRITWKLAARTREFKMKVYPSFVTIPIIFLYNAMLNMHGTMADKLQNLNHGKAYIFLAYFSCIILSAIVTNISQSEKFKASWVYYALPVTQPGKILSGMYKAIVMLYYLPYYLVLSAAMIWIWGPGIINDLILAFCVGTIYGVLVALFMIKGLPFSQPVMNRQAGGKMISSFAILIFIGGLGFAHYFIARWETLIWILTVPAIGLVWAMLYYYRKQSWDSIELSEV